MSTRPRLGAAIIVKNEANFLRSCLQSISAVCDEIVVVDTGSTDDSVAVAASFGATLGTYPWDGDFAAARNVALDLITAKWVLYIDADEVLRPTTPEAAWAELDANDDAVALRLRLRVRVGFTVFREFRLWKNRPDLRFHGRIHETLVPQLERINEQEGLAIRTTDAFELQHYGYEGDQTEKNARNLPILLRRVEELPNRCYLWNHLGLIHLDMGNDAEALAAWNRGIALIRARGVVDRADIICYDSITMYLIDRGLDAHGLIEECLAVAGNFLTMYWALGRNHIAQGRYAEALEPLRTLTRFDLAAVDEVIAYKEAMLTEWPWAALGECHFELGDFAAAAHAYEMAASFAPTSLEYRSKAAASRALARTD